MTNRFAQIPRADIPRSTFDRSHGVKTTFDADYIVPILCDEAVPGDTISCNLTGFARLSTPVKAVMDNMFMETFFFAVPYRLVWDNWVKMHGEQDDPGDSIDFTIPQMVAPAGGHLNESLSDYFGIPTKIASLSHSTLFHRAYNLIWNEWFRDQNLQNSVTVDKDNGPDTSTDYVLLKRGKRHDYFTSSLPWPQKGDAVTIPLGTEAKIASTADFDNVGDAANYANVLDPAGTDVKSITSSGATAYFQSAAAADQTNYMYADLTNATAATINQLRQSFQIQKMLERDARGGTRYIEIILSHFGVQSPDARVQRPEFLGGGSQMVNINPVPQTSESNTTNQGNISAFGTVGFGGHGFTKSFTEHCLILGFVNVRADITYQQGLNRMFSRSTRYDFYYPSLAHIGEQSVLNKEIYADASANDDLVFGYQERYAEMRYKPSQITGKFRSNDASSLDVWHLSEDFSTLPSLNSTFIQSNAGDPIDRVIATPSEPHFLFDGYFNYRHIRPMPVYGVPGLIDHF